MPPTRVIGFDLARAYATLGMFIVNFNTVYGTLTHAPTQLGQLLTLFNGSASSLFVVLAGLGVALLKRRATTAEARARLRTVVLRRSWFLFFLGLFLFLWWPADILHFYGGYLHLAAPLLFVRPRFYLLAAAGAVVGFHALLPLVPYETGWNFTTFQYADFWTVRGFLRNTFYNGWNPIFPWAAYFFGGLWLGHLDWTSRRVRRRVLLVGLGMFGGVALGQALADRYVTDALLKLYLTATYLPPFLPFLLRTTGLALVVIPLCFALGERLGHWRALDWLAQTGQLTLTHYVLHLTAGMLLLGALTDRRYGDLTQTPLPPLGILAFAVVFFGLSLAGSVFWRRRFRHGPLEALMRRLDGSR